MRAKMILFLLAVPMLPACTSADYARSTANVNDDLYYMPAPATPATTVVQAPPVSGAAAPAEAAPAVRYEDGMSDYERYLLEKESAQTTVPSGAVSGTAARQSTASETRGELFYADDGSVYYSGPSATVEETPSAAKSGKTTVVNNYYYYDDPWYDPWYYDPWYDPWYYDPWYDGYLFRDPYYYRSWASPRFSIGYSTGWGFYPRSRWSIHLGWGWDPLFYHATGFYHDPFYRPVIAFIDPPRPRTDHTTYGPASRRENTLNNVSRRIVAADVADAALPGDRVPVQQAATRRTAGTAGTGSSAGSAAPAARSPQPAAASGTQSTARTRREALNEAQAAAGSGTTQTYNRTQSGQTYNQSAARTDISRNADQAVPARQGSAGTYTAPSTERTVPVANPRREAVNSAQQQSRTAPQSSSTQPAVQQRNTQPAVQQPQQQSSGNATRRAARSTATQSSNNTSSTATRSATRSAASAAASSAATRSSAASSASSAATRSSAASSFGSSASTRSGSTYSAPSYSSTPSFSTSPSFGSSGGFSSGGGATRSGASSSGSSSRR